MIPLHYWAVMKRPPGQSKPIWSHLKQQSYSSVWFKSTDIFLLSQQTFVFGGFWHIIPAFETLIAQPKLTETAAKQDAIISGSCSEWATRALPSVKSSSSIRGLLKLLFLHTNKPNYKRRLGKSKSGLSETDSVFAQFAATEKKKNLPTTEML